MPLAGEQLTAQRSGGLLLGLAGVTVLMLGRGAGFDSGTLLPVVAMLAATACYGWSGHMTKRWLHGVPPLVITAGMLCSGSLLLLPLAWWQWPAG